jgi:hypothetical protein
MPKPPRKDTATERNSFLVRANEANDVTLSGASTSVHFAVLCSQLAKGDVDARVLGVPWQLLPTLV